MFMRLHSGGFVDCSGPEPVIESIQLEDITIGLSGLWRFSGQMYGALDVLDHSLEVSDSLHSRYGARMALLGLMHDASEAITGDIPSPIKPMLLGVRRVERALQAQILDRFNVPAPTRREKVTVKQADLASLVYDLDRSGWARHPRWANWIRQVDADRSLISYRITYDDPEAEFEARFHAYREELGYDR